MLEGILILSRLEQPLNALCGIDEIAVPEKFTDLMLLQSINAY